MKKGKRYFPGNTKIKYLCLILAIVLFLAAIPWDSSLISALAEDGLESVLQGGTESTQQGPSEVIGEEPTETEEESTEDGELSEDETEELEDELVQPASEDAGVKTVFFDTSGNGGWNGWNKDSTMYIYRIGVDTGPNEMERVDSGIFALDADFSGVLWKYTVPAECAGVIFLPISSWGDAASQTTDLYFANFSQTDSAYPCFYLDGGSSGSNKTALCKNLKLKSQAGKTLNFVNMTNNSFAGVTAVFGGAKSAGTVECSMTISENGLYTVTIPDDAEGENGAAIAYQTVYFKDENGNQLGQVYNFFNSPADDSEVGVVYDADTYNTFYYGVTENSNGTKISSWGAAPSNAQEPLQGKTLYFDKVFFDAGRTWKLQIGDGSPVTLSTDSDDGNTIVYTFAIDTAATQQTLLTLITDDGVMYHFKWSEFGSGDAENNLAVLNSNVLVVSGTYKKTNTVFFDATLSKLSYAGDQGDYGIPNQGGTIRYYATGDGMADLEGDMTKAEEYTSGSHTWSDVYRADLPDGYTKITFASFDMNSGTNYGGHGESTTQLDIPADIKNPCFYADSSDASIYDGGVRSGYWDSVYVVRDAGQKKENHTVVDIPVAEETRNPAKKYFPVTMYDFYTDYELNGSNRDNYNNSTGIGTHRIYQPFRQFNQALSSYYEKNGAQSPLYWGNFQNYDGAHYSQIRDALNLFGSYDAGKFFYENNSMWGRNGTELSNGNNATQGLVADTLDANGDLMIQTGSGAVKAPFLDKSFLGGNNSKNTVLGRVYEDVTFPFTKKALTSQSSSGTPGTVDYWVFDSADSSTNLRLKQTAAGDYFLDSTNSVVKGQTAGKGTPATTSGNFFPFNDSNQSGNSRILNYGFASKLEFEFRLTENGTVTTTEGNPVPIEFTFSGDDDVWIFIDGKLALDIGGGHGVVSGYLNFKDSKYYVSSVKNTSGGGFSSNVTGSFNLTGAKTDEHTLTMFYMERGLWESNMKITYNFPDENSLEVEKQVDKADVNPIFADLFDNTSLFTFFIKNQATHYGPKAVVTSGEKVDPVSIDISACELKKPAAQNTFELTSENTIHWKALMEDRTGAYRHLRYGGIALDNPVDISKMKYLQYSFYYDYRDNPSLSNMYLYLVDSAGKTKGGSDYLSGKTYGAVTMKGKEWINVKIDLAKLQEEAGFNGTMVSEIRFGYNFPRDIYLKDFVFSPSAAYVGQTGFITKQYDIPDYGSADPNSENCGKLVIPVGAQYVSSNGGNYAIGEDGTFVLQNGESVTFNDQFRRGSYIYLKEDDSEAVRNLFTTSWTMYENGRAVTSMGTGDNDTVDLGSNTNLSGISGYAVDDGRTERYKDVSDGDGVQLANKGYTQSVRPKDEKGNPESVFVFRSYSYPASGSSAITKLKAVFTNKVKVGSLTITKGAAYKLDETALKGEYRFKVSFTNVGGLALENEAVVQTVKLRYGESYTITGIPIGTSYTVEEITTDGSTLDSVVIEGADSDLADFAQDTKVISGTVHTESASGVAASVTLTFKNTKKPTVNVSLEKYWVKEVDSSEPDKPESIWVQLQRRKKNTTDNYEVIKAADGKPDPNYEAIEITPGYDDVTGTIRWHYSITGLDKVVDYENNDETEWEYRFVELDPEKKTVLEENGTYVITKQNEGGESGTDSEIFRVTYSSGTVGGDAGYSTNMTNTLLGPVNLEVYKTAKHENADPTALKDVTFKLEMQSIVDGQETWGPLPGKTEDAVATTGEDGKVNFVNLKDGTYRLTEIKTAEGYTLLMKSVIVTISRKTDTYTWKLEGEDDDSTDYSGELIWDKDTRTLVINISNIQNIQLPFTGGSSSFPLVAGGVLLSTISGVLYIEEKSRKMAKKKARGKRER